MAFTSANMTLVGNGGGQKLWIYKSNDLETAISASGYFDSMAGVINTGDLLIVYADADGTPGVHMYALANSTGDATGTITIVNQTIVV